MFEVVITSFALLSAATNAFCIYKLLKKPQHVAISFPIEVPIAPVLPTVIEAPAVVPIRSGRTLMKSDSAAPIPVIPELTKEERRNRPIDPVKEAEIRENYNYRRAPYWLNDWGARRDSSKPSPNSY